LIFEDFEDAFPLLDAVFADVFLETAPLLLPEREAGLEAALAPFEAVAEPLEAVEAPVAAVFDFEEVFLLAAADFDPFDADIPLLADAAQAVFDTDLEFFVDGFFMEEPDADPALVAEPFPVRFADAGFDTTVFTAESAAPTTAPLAAPDKTSVAISTALS